MLRLSEAPYLSVNGEGTLVGKPVIFTRLQGCGVGCTWCDSKYTWKKGGKEWSRDDLFGAFLDIGRYPIWWTGGEPMEQSEQLKDMIASNVAPIGSDNILMTAAPFFDEGLFKLLDTMVIDVKLKSANIKYNQMKVIEEYVDYDQHSTVELKMVVDTPDIAEAILIASKFPEVEITMQPLYWDEITWKKEAKRQMVPGHHDGMIAEASQPANIGLSQWMEKMMPLLSDFPNVRLLPQLHKMIWPTKQRGI